MTDVTNWAEYVERTLGCYHEGLVRDVAAQLIRPRNQWPVEDLIERCVAALGNAPVIDRRLAELEPAGRRALDLIARSRQPRWRLGNLIEMLAALGSENGLTPLLQLLEAGLLYPDLYAPQFVVGEAPVVAKLGSFEQWLGLANTGLTVFAPPQVTGRALGSDLGLPDLSAPTPPVGPIQEADGLEWCLRVGAAWQLVSAMPLRRTQPGDFFKRDLERLRGDPVLGSQTAEGLAELPDLPLLALSLSQLEGAVREHEGELTAGTLPAVWEEGLPEMVASLWSRLPHLEAWDPLDGTRSRSAIGNPFPSAYLLALLLLKRLPAGAWAAASDVGVWVQEHHPFWAGEEVRPSRLRDWMTGFLLGFCYPLRLLQAAKSAAGEWLVRPSPLGRWVLGERTVEDLPSRTSAFPQTWTVQPNHEVIAYRQGLTPHLVGRLTHFAAWQNLGAACTLQLQPDTVYRALQAGDTFDTILRTLDLHGMRPTPTAVKDALRTWANKRERISVYPSATLLEFASAEDLNEAVARGLAAARLSDRLAVVAGEGAIDYRNYRLLATRDYGAPPEKCVEVESDGVTLTLDLSRSDLLLETELPRFAERLERSSAEGKRQYRLTPASLAAGRASGLSLIGLDNWFLVRTGQGLPPAARLLLTATDLPTPDLKRQLVLHVATPETAEGLMQWPGTRSLVHQRLGPTALAIDEENAEELRVRLRALGVTLAEG